METAGESSVAYRGKEMASIVRSCHWGGARVNPMEIWQAFERMMAGEAATAEDALALVTVARLLLDGDAHNLSDTQDNDFRLECLSAVLAKAEQALEAATGLDHDLFACRLPALARPQ